MIGQGYEIVSEYSAPIINPPAQRHLYENKIHNIRLVENRVNGVAIAPGEIFSFWYLVGRPSRDNGFREAATFVNKRVVSDIGGGICQISGVLYNAALLANCKIIERHPHTIDAYGEGRYIPLGRDATVAYGIKDLKFENTQSTDIVLFVRITDNSATAQLFSKTKDFAKVDIEITDASEVVDNSSLEKNAVRTTVTYRRVQLSNNETTKHLISTDTYMLPRN